MKKKLFRWLIALAVVLPCMIVAASAASGSVVETGDFYNDLTYTLYADGELVIAGEGRMEDFWWDYEPTLDDTSNEIYVDSPWFSWRNKIKSVTIADGVEHIGAYAFYDCENLTSITIGNGVTSIDFSAFWECGNLAELFVTYDNPAYSSFGNVLYSGDVYDYKQATLIWCPQGIKTSSYAIPEGVTKIGDRAFSGCYGLTSITIPACVASIGKDAFDGCYGLTSVYYTGDIAGWCGISFAGGSPDASNAYSNPMTYTDKVYIGGELISGELVIPDGVTNIGNYAFISCNSLTSVTISDSVRSIGSYAFSHCYGLSGVTIGNGVASIGNSAFRECIRLTSVSIGNGVTSIGDGAFAGCNSLTALSIPDSVTSIGDSVFSSCFSLTSVTIPDSVTSIGDGAFAGCNGLTAVSIPDSVTSIGDSAFCSCDSLTSVTIPDSVTSIGDWAFEHCNSLTSVTIPDSVTSIGDGAFYSCDGLTSVSIGNGVTSIGEDAFEFCSSLTSVTIPDSVTSIGGYAFASCDSLTAVSIPDSVTSIKEGLFYDCTQLTRLEFEGDAPALVEVIAFYGCSNLTVYYQEGTTGWPTTGTWQGRPLVMLEVPKYSVTIGEMANGTVTAEPIVGKAGEIVTVTATPAAGYALDKILVDGVAIEGNTFPITGDHTVTATFGAAIAKIGETGYIDLEQAFAAAQDGDTIRLLGDYRREKYGSVIFNAEKDVTLDLGGNWIVNNIMSTAHSGVVVESGTLTLKNGTVGVASPDCSGIYLKGGKLIVAEDAKIWCGTEGVRIYDDAQLEVYGEVFALNYSRGDEAAIETYSTNCSIRIYEGAVVSNKICAVNSGAADVVISGGNFTGNIVLAEGTTITGGTFDMDVSEYVADGYVCTPSGERYVVSRPAPIVGTFQPKVVKTITINGQEYRLCRWYWTPKAK